MAKENWSEYTFADGFQLWISGKLKQYQLKQYITEHGLLLKSRTVKI